MKLPTGYKPGHEEGVCIRCKNKFIRNSRIQKRCPTCARIVKQETSKNWRKENGSRTTAN